MKNFNSIMCGLSRNLGSNIIETEFEYFKEYARRFDDNLPEKRYGILPIGIEPSLDNMIYAPCVQSLRVKHLQYIEKNGINEAHKVRKFIDWLEEAEGKTKHTINQYAC